MKRYLLSTLLLAGCQTTTPKPVPTTPEAKLAEKTQNLVNQTRLPSLSIMLLDDQKVLNQAVSGVRKYGSPEKVTLQDVHHLGSISKSFTGTLIATFVEQKTLSFDSTLGALLPEWNMRNEYKAITVGQLLSHRSGIVANLEPDPAWWDASVPLETRKKAHLEKLFQTPLKHAPGTAFEYSNSGYAVLAAIAEVVGQKPFETLMDTRIFKPLQMKGCSMGYTWDSSSVSQPWPHIWKNGVPEAVTPEYPTVANGFVVAGNTEVINGADNVRCPLADLARYLQDHMQGENGKNGLLKASTYQELHKDHFGDGYAYGWAVAKNPQGQLILGHDGSNTLNYASVLVAPDARMALIGTTNIGGDTAMNAIYAGMEEALKLQQSSKTVTPSQYPASSGREVSERSPLLVHWKGLLR